MATCERIVGHLGERESDIGALCQALVRIPSEDPPGDNRPICAYLQQYLLDRGVATTLHGPDPTRPNLVGRIVFEAPGPNVVFNGHMETLPVGDRSRWTGDPFAGAIADGRLYGRGAQCMKAGIAGLISAALALRECGKNLGGAITLAFVSDEVNGGGVGTGYLVDHVPEVQGDVALVGEASLGINFGHKGVVFAEFRATGDGGHGAYGYRASSATHRMLEVLEEVRRLDGLDVTPPADVRERLEEVRAFTDAHLGAGATDALLRLSVNVGTIQGGRKVNVIADDCVAHVDFRLPPGMTVADLQARIGAIIRRHPGVAVRTLWANDPTVSSPDHPWFQTLQRASARVLGEPLRFRYSHGFSDARFFRLKGIPAAAIGVRGANVGAPDEYIELENLVSIAKLYAVSTHEYLAGRRSGG